MALGLGWIGLLFGLQLDRRQLAHFPSSFLVLTVLQAAVALGVFLAGGALLLRAVDATAAEANVALLAAAATACVSTPAGVALINRTFRVRGEVSRLLFFMASVDAVVGIIALQVTYALRHPVALAGGLTQLAPWEWIAVAVSAGIVFGVFFLWLTRPKPDREELTLYLMGLVVFVAGSALYLGISPLFVAAVAGAVIGNLSPSQRRVFNVLQDWEQPIYVILLILAGALLSFPTWLVLPLALAYFLLRGLGKLVGGWVAARTGMPDFRVPPGMGLGLLSQGGISLAMAISITLTYGTLELHGVPLVDVVFSTVVLGVVLSEIFGPVMTRRLLRQVGEITPRAEEAAAGGDR
jgi:Kef-type K+ transport system membrane component KefB